MLNYIKKIPMWYLYRYGELSYRWGLQDLMTHLKNKKKGLVWKPVTQSSDTKRLQT